ncbi:MAG: biotin/lipoyl-containing protein, partial [Betaproteobacteria bacterium]
MPIPVILPTLGPASEDAVLVKWLVPIGAFVRRGDPLFSVETDKTLTDIESPDEGFLIEITVEEGATIQIDQQIAFLDDQASSGAAQAAPVTQSPVTSEEPAAAVIAAPVSTHREPAVTTPEEATAQRHDSAPLGKGHASPRARRLARESGV